LALQSLLVLSLYWSLFMRRLMVLLVLAALVLSAGCGQGPKVETPKEVPPAPKSGPNGIQGPGGRQNTGEQPNKPSTAEPISP
jgi:hypothetical protein